ncbi:MAG TPA: hypothetical protein VEQ60_11270 [Longimicrobium sp.]|nr:hypothetical protein [Longimicrobium sp.]
MPARTRSMCGVRARYSLFPIPYSLLFVLLSAACGDEDRTQTEFTASIDKTSTSADDTAAVPARAVPVPDTLQQPAPPQVTVGISLAPLGRATVRGSGQVKAVGKATSVSVALSQGIAGVTYEGAIRQGGCAAMGPNVASLYPVTADSLGNGRTSSDTPLPIDSLTSKPHVIVYGRGGRPETCAPIGPPSTTPPPPARPDIINVPYADTMGG